MVVTNRTEMSSEECYNLLVKSTKREYINKSWMILLMFLIGIPVLVIGAYQNETIYTVMGSVFMGLSAAYLGVTVFNVKRMPKLLKEKNKEIVEYGATYLYSFREQSVDVEIHSHEKKNKLKLQYITLRKIKEFDSYYELKFENEFVLYVTKSGFENKKMEEFFRSNVTWNQNKEKKKKIIDKRSKEAKAKN